MREGVVTGAERPGWYIAGDGDVSGSSSKTRSAGFHSRFSRGVGPGTPRCRFVPTGRFDVGTLVVSGEESPAASLGMLPPSRQVQVDTAGHRRRSDEAEGRRSRCGPYTLQVVGSVTDAHACVHTGRLLMWLTQRARAVSPDFLGRQAASSARVMVMS